ncbi:MAG: hypothetical protein ACK55I_44600, partial [bacterium]
APRRGPVTGRGPRDPAPFLASLQDRHHHVDRRQRKVEVAAMRAPLVDGRSHVGKPRAAIVRPRLAAPVGHVGLAEGVVLDVERRDIASGIRDLDRPGKEVRVRHEDR